MRPEMSSTKSENVIGVEATRPRNGRGSGQGISNSTPQGPTGRRRPSSFRSGVGKIARVLSKYTRFIGPGFMVSVAYIDPGNYSTDVTAGATYRFKLLFIVLMSNLFAIFLQSLCIKLGTVTGLNLAEHCKAHCPPWLNIVLYIFAESAIIATDIAEVRRPFVNHLLMDSFSN
jgi:metal iron transporter